MQMTQRNFTQNKRGQIKYQRQKHLNNLAMWIKNNCHNENCKIETICTCAKTDKELHTRNAC